MNYDRFSGDPAVKLTNNGAKMKFVGGQCVMDQGVENATLISLFTKPNWWGNTLIDDPNKKVGSKFERQRTIIDVQTINDVFDDATQALKWMKDSKLSSKIDITVTNPRLDFIQTKIDIYSPAGTLAQILLLKNGPNWISQAKNPAHERMKDVI
jgi:phage gp46-like protein